MINIKTKLIITLQIQALTIAPVQEATPLTNNNNKTKRLATQCPIKENITHQKEHLAQFLIVYIRDINIEEEE